MSRIFAALLAATFVLAMFVTLFLIMSGQSGPVIHDVLAAVRMSLIITAATGAAGWLLLRRRMPAIAEFLSRRAVVYLSDDILAHPDLEED